MGYDKLPLELEIKILDEIEWTETVICKHVCVRWRDHLSKPSATSKRYLEDRDTLRSRRANQLARERYTVEWGSWNKHRLEQDPKQDIGEGYGSENDTVSESLMSQRLRPVHLHRFVHESEASFGFFVRVDPMVPYAPLSSVSMPSGFFLMGNKELHSQPNSLGGKSGTLALSPPNTSNLEIDDSDSEPSINSEIAKDDVFHEEGRHVVQLNSAWHWKEQLFNSPIGDTEIKYGHGFEKFNYPGAMGPSQARSRQLKGKYLRLLSELEYPSRQKTTIQDLVRAVSQSVRMIKLLDQETRENGGVFFVKFNGIQVREYLKHIPQGFFSFYTGGKIELESYEGVVWTRAA